MATISRTGIVNGSAIAASHITNIIDALDGTGVGITVVATGSFSGSLAGTASFASIATTASYVLQGVSASFATTATSATTASYVLQAVSASFATTASFALNSGGSTFPFTGSAIISGSLRVTGSLNVSVGGVTASAISTPQFTISASTATAGANLVLSLSDIAKSSGTGMFIIPKQVPTSPVEGTMYWHPDSNSLYIYNEAAGWLKTTLS